MSALYFGARDVVGHYWWRHDGQKARSLDPATDSGAFSPHPFETHIDGRYAPRGDLRQGAARLIHKGGWTLLAWHDYTVDRRPGSNSNVLAEGTHSIESILCVLFEHWPDVHKRQPVIPFLAERARNER